MVFCNSAEIDVHKDSGSSHSARTTLSCGAEPRLSCPLNDMYQLPHLHPGSPSFASHKPDPRRFLWLYGTMEVAGVISAKADSVADIIKKYQKLLERTARSTDFFRLRTKILLNRAKFETGLQHLSRLQELPLDVVQIFTDIQRTLDEISSSLKINNTPRKEETLSDVPGLNLGMMAGITVAGALLGVGPSLLAFSSGRAIKNTIVGETAGHLQNLSEPSNLSQRKTEVHLQHLSKLNDSLISNETTPEYLMDIEGIKRPGQGHILPEKRSRDAVALSELVESCSLLLELLGNEDSCFAEFSNRFKLWRHGVELERFYQTIKLDLRPDTRHRFELLLYQAMLHMGESIGMLFSLCV